MPQPARGQPASVARPDGAPGNAQSYSFKPSLMGAPHEFTLTAAGMEWRIGRHAGRIPYEAIRRIRLSFRPMTMASQRYLAEIWADATPKLTIASTSWRSIVEQQRQDDAYTAFIAALHRRLTASSGLGVFEAGTTPWLYWPGVVVFAAVALVLAFLVIRALQAGATGGAAFVGGFLALFLWQLGRFFQRNRPRRYRAEAMPRDVLPGG